MLGPRTIEDIDEDLRKLAHIAPEWTAKIDELLDERNELRRSQAMTQLEREYIHTQQSEALRKMWGDAFEAIDLTSDGPNWV